MGKKEEEINIEADSDIEVVQFIVRLFSKRLNPPKDDDGKYKKGVPHTRIQIILCNQSNSMVLTRGSIYNYSPSQVIDKIKEAMK